MRASPTKRFGTMGAIALTALSMGAAPVLAADSSDPVKIALFDWTSVNLNAKILGGVLEKLGDTVEYPTGDYLSSLTTSLAALTLPLGILSVTLLFLGIILAPILPEWTREHKGLLVKVLGACLLIGWVPSLVAAFMGS